MNYSVNNWFCHDYCGINIIVKTNVTHSRNKGFYAWWIFATTLY